MFRPILLFLFLLLLHSHGNGQNTRGDLLVQKEPETDPYPLIHQIKRGIADTSQVNLLTKIAHIYWHKRKADNFAVDSTLLYARQAYTISKNIKFTEGYNEAVFLMCKALLEKKDVQAALKLTQEVYGEELVRLLLIIAEPYVFNYQSDDKQFQNALPIIERGNKISRQIKSVRWSNECANLLAKYHFKQGDIISGKQDMMQAITAHHKEKDYNNEAKYWSRLGTYMPENSSTFPAIIHSHQMAVRYYLLADNKKEAGYSLRDLAVIRGNHNQTQKAGRNLMEMLDLFKSAGEPLSTTTYYILSEYYRFTGNYDKALYYGFEGLKAAADNEEKKIKPYIALATTYGFLKDYKNAIRFYQIVLDYYVKNNKPSMFVSCYNIVNLQAASGEPKKALIFLNRFLKEHPPVSVNHQELFASTYGYIYSLLGDYKTAERYYHQMLSLDEKADQENGKNLGTHLTLAGGGAYYLMGKFYAERSRYQEAKVYLQKSLHNPQYFDKDQELNTYQLLFKADSAKGNYLSAIRYFERHKVLSDSINSVAKANQISELNIQYQTAQRAKDIKLLEDKQVLQQAAIQKSNTIRNFTIAAAILFSLLAISAYLGYRNKKRSNLLLQIKQDEINSQNTELQTLLLEKELFLIEKDELILEKDGLLKEKDWLLKEVHHRVKNNLQIIMSLLRTQLANLKTEDAKNAILESENRVQAIALIHQKLYNTDKVASISMPAYVSGLVNYLGDGLAAKHQKVRFHLSVEMIYLDLAQAVPLGLILNEAITNAIKYGFNDTGVDISINFGHHGDGKVMLTIADKGKGLPADFDLLSSKSLGMQIIRGLSKQLKGSLHINSDGGVTVTVKFNLIPVFSPNVNKESVSSEL